MDVNDGEADEGPLKSVYDLEYYLNHNISSTNPLTGLGAGDSSLYLNCLPEEFAGSLFANLDNELNWNEMEHRGGVVPRLISIQGVFGEDGSQPLYRHPADEQPVLSQFTPFAELCRQKVSSILGQEFNHALIQKYRTGKDNISEHADKSLDIKIGTVIANLSVGATRVMTLKSKPNHTSNNYSLDVASGTSKRIIQKVVLPANSVFVLGWQTNVEFLHSIRPDKRKPVEKRPDELLYQEQRISLTFRTISTFLTPEGIIYGQGARLKTKPSSADALQPAVSEEERAEESVRLIEAFGVENRDAQFSWQEHYGKGFEVLNFKYINK